MKKKVIIYNKYLKTAGGGERSTLDHALAFASYGLDVEIVADEKESVDLNFLYSQFGIEKNKNITLKNFDSRQELEEYLQKENPQIFCNHCFNDTMKNYGKIGVYIVMFPNMGFALKEYNNLKTYDVFSCISDFTKIYVKKIFGNDIKAVTLVPPISKSHSENTKAVDFSKKEKLILNVGRFNVGGHNKGQLKAIESFIKLNEENVLDDSWKMILCGQFNDTEGTREYLEDCKKLAKNHNIEIHTNAEFDFLCDCYKKATCLWQFTGYGLDFGVEPQKCEHLGLVALDALSYGTLPIIYSRSGASFLLEIGQDGFVFNDYNDIKNEMKIINDLYGTEYHKFLSKNAIEKSKTLTFECFEKRFHEIIKGLLNE